MHSRCWAPTKWGHSCSPCGWVGHNEECLVPVHQEVMSSWQRGAYTLVIVRLGKCHRLTVPWAQNAEEKCVKGSVVLSAEKIRKGLVGGGRDWRMRRRRVMRKCAMLEEKACHFEGRMHFIVVDGEASWVQHQNVYRVIRGKIMKSLVRHTELGIHPIGKGDWGKLIQKKCSHSETGEIQRTLLESRMLVGKGKSGDRYFGQDVFEPFSQDVRALSKISQ